MQHWRKCQHLRLQRRPRSRTTGLKTPSSRYISAGLPGCPAPEGPLLTFEEQRKEAHWRAERGTSCWLAGKCRDSNAYRYDKTLADPVRAALLAVPGVAASSVWVTIQRRWVFLEGCVSSPEQAQQLEQAAK